MSISRRANLFIIGAPKSGTTSLHDTLSELPGFNCSKTKEANYFSHKHLIRTDRTPTISSLSDYERIFDFSKDYKFHFETSPSYLYFKDTAQQIYNYNADAKIIIILRNPIDRAVSHYLMDLNRYAFSLDCFPIEFHRNYILGKGAWGSELNPYRDLSLYSEHIENFFSVFPQEQIKVFSFESLTLGNLENLNKLSLFLGLSTPIIELKVSNKAISSRNKLLTKLVMHPYFRALRWAAPTSVTAQLKKIVYAQAKQKLELNRSEYAAFFRADIDRLSEITGEDYSETWQ